LFHHYRVGAGLSIDAGALTAAAIRYPPHRRSVAARTRIYRLVPLLAARDGLLAGAGLVAPHGRAAPAPIVGYPALCVLSALRAWLGWLVVRPALAACAGAFLVAYTQQRTAAKTPVVGHTAVCMGAALGTRYGGGVVRRSGFARLAAGPAVLLALVAEPAVAILHAGEARMAVCAACFEPYVEAVAQRCGTLWITGQHRLRIQIKPEHARRTLHVLAVLAISRPRLPRDEGVMVGHGGETGAVDTCLSGSVFYAASFTLRAF